MRITLNVAVVRQHNLPVDGLKNCGFSRSIRNEGVTYKVEVSLLQLTKFVCCAGAEDFLVALIK